MYAQLKKRRGLIISTVAGAAGAAALYYWFTKDSDEGELDEQCTGSCSQGEAGEGKDGPATMDANIHSQFQYIQSTSTPQELDHVLPLVKDTLYEMTDVRSALASLPPDATANEKMHILALHSIGRTLTAVWLLPTLDMLVRTKLNIVGRHLLVQEKLANLRQLQSQHDPAFSKLSRRLGMRPGGVPVVPLHVHATAVQTFLPCHHFTADGAQMLITEVLAIVNTWLRGVSLDTACGPEELVGLLAAAHKQITHQLFVSARPDVWAVLLQGRGQAEAMANAAAMWGLGPQSVSPYGSSPTTSPEDPLVIQVVAELEQELVAALNSPQFSTALQQAVEFSWSQLVRQLVDGFPDQPGTSTSPPPATNNPSEQPQQPQQPQQQQDATSAGEISGSDQLCEIRSDSGVGSGSGEEVVVEGVDTATTTSSAAHQQSWWSYFKSGLSAAAAYLPTRLATSDSSSATTCSSSPATDAPGPQVAPAPQPAAVMQFPVRPARPLSRLLRLTQLAADPHVATVQEWSRDMAHQPAILSFTAAIFSGSLSLSN